MKTTEDAEDDGFDFVPNNSDRRVRGNSQHALLGMDSVGASLRGAMDEVCDIFLD